MSTATDEKFGVLQVWFPTKRYGFLSTSGGGTDTFVHISAFRESGITNNPEDIHVGERFWFQSIENVKYPGRATAVKLRRDGETPEPVVETTEADTAGVERVLGAN